MKTLFVAGLVLGALAFQAHSASAQEADAGAESFSGAQAGSSASINNTSPADVNLYNTPNVTLSPLTAGMTDCTGSTTAGAGWAGGIISFGRTRALKDCQRMNMARIAYTMGKEVQAFEIMCANDEWRRAALAAGTPCLIDREHTMVTLEPQD